MEAFFLLLLFVVVAVLVVREFGRSAAEDARTRQQQASLQQLEMRLRRMEEAWRAGTLNAPAQPLTPPAAPAPAHPTPGPAAQPTPPQQQPAATATQPATTATLRPAQAVPAAAPPAYATQPAPAPQRPVEAAAHTPAPPPARSLSLEERLGQNWLNKLGIATLVAGLALFLGFQLRTLGPAGKSAIGLLLSLTLLVGGVLLERRERYRIFARGAIGGGWALTYFVTFALYHVQAMQVIHSQPLDLVLMFAVAGAMVAHSLRYRSQTVTSLAFLLAFLTVGISQVTLFSLVAGAILAVALVAIAWRQGWFYLSLAGLVGVYCNHFLWLHRVLPGGGQVGVAFPQLVPSVLLLCLYWLLFRLFYVFRAPQDGLQVRVGALMAVLNSVGLLGLMRFQSSHPEWAFAGLLAIGLVELGLAFVARRQNRPAFVVLSSLASALLVAAVPFRYHGAGWTIFWLLEAEALLLAGLRLREPVLRRLGILAGLLTAGTILFGGLQALVTGSPLQRTLPSLLAVGCAALVLWFNAEGAPRLWSQHLSSEFDRAALRVTSYLAGALGGLSLWLLLPTPALGSDWLACAWLLLALVVAVAADRTGSASLATESDLLALAGLLRTVAVNLALTGHWHGLPMRALTVGLAVALLYVAMLRRTAATLLPTAWIAVAYSWLAAGLLALLLWRQLDSASVALAWTAVGVGLFELGRARGAARSFFRHQGYALLAAGWLRFLLINAWLPDAPHGWPARLTTALPLAVACYWMHTRLRGLAANSGLDGSAAVVAACAGTATLATTAALEIRGAWLGESWALLAGLLLAVAWWLLPKAEGEAPSGDGVPLWVGQSLLMLVAAVVAVLVNNFLSVGAPPSWKETGWVCICGASGVMLLTLPVAFAVRRGLSSRLQLNVLLRRPEQPFFFAPLGLLMALMVLQFSGSTITLGWAGLGVAAFLLALWAGERSFRLAGLAVLLLAVAKVLLLDVWRAAPTDRYLTLIALGVALLLVSFLYSRYRDTLLKLL